MSVVAAAKEAGLVVGSVDLAGGDPGCRHPAGGDADTGDGADDQQAGEDTAKDVTAHGATSSERRHGALSARPPRSGVSPPD